MVPGWWQVTDLQRMGRKSLSWEHLKIGQERKGEKWAIISPGHGRAAGKDAPTCEGDAPPAMMQEDGPAPGQTEQRRLLLSSSDIKVGSVGTCSDWRSPGNSGFAVRGLVPMEVELAQPWEISRIYTAIPGSLLEC